MQKNNQDKKLASLFIKQKFRPGSLFYGKRGGNCRGKGSANRMKFQKYLRISEMPPTFNLQVKVSANRMNLQISKDKMHKKFIFLHFATKSRTKNFVAY